MRKEMIDALAELNFETGLEFTLQDDGAAKKKYSLVHPEQGEISERMLFKEMLCYLRGFYRGFRFDREEFGDLPIPFKPEPEVRKTKLPWE